MAARRRPGFDPKAGFRNQRGAVADTSGVHPAMLKQARASGQLNLSSRALSEGSLTCILIPPLQMFFIG